MRYSDRYAPVEAEARSRQVGLWQGAAEAPWQFRSDGGFAAAPGTAPGAAAADPPSEGCAIKGNISGDGERIYHLPGQRYYDVTRINRSKGERWFCSEDQARDAGWRASRV